MNELEMKITEANESIDWEYLGDLGNFMTSPHSQNVWITKQLRKVRESNVQNDQTSFMQNDQTSFNGYIFDGTYIFDDTNNVKPSVQWEGRSIRTVAFMEHTIGELQAIALDIAEVLGHRLDSILDEAHMLLGAISIDEAQTWMPKIYQYQYPHETAKYIGIGIACWGNIINEHGNATGKWKGCTPSEFSFGHEG